MECITYPLRPRSGANLDRMTPRRFGKWKYEPKYDGWRSVIFPSKGLMWNRKGEPLSIQKDFPYALEILRKCPLSWIDAEALQRRHEHAKGTLIVLDTIYTDKTYGERRKVLEDLFPVLNVEDVPQSNTVYIPPSYDCDKTLWEAVRNNNFYEGIVAKKENSCYTIQTVSESRTFDGWVKHRFDR